jgi:antimicrobial peptide system SdpA family protein
VSTSNAGNRAPESRGLLARVVLYSAMSAIVIVYAIHGSMPKNALKLPFENEVDTVVFLPEAWAFFTRNPREPKFAMYRQSADGAWTQLGGKQGEPATTMGLERGVRAINFESGGLLGQIKEASWRRCSSELTPCLTSATAPVVSLVNRATHPGLCGSITFVQQDRLPWAWAKTVSQESMPLRVARLEVQC